MRILNTRPDHAFETFWAQHGRATTEWTNMTLQPPQHVVELPGASGQFPEITSRYIEEFDDANDFVEWFMDTDKAAAHFAEVTAGSAH